MGDPDISIEQKDHASIYIWVEGDTVSINIAEKGCNTVGTELTKDQARRFAQELLYLL